MVVLVHGYDIDMIGTQPFSYLQNTLREALSLLECALLSSVVLGRCFFLWIWWWKADRISPKPYCRPRFKNRASKLMSFRLCSKLWFLVLFLIEMSSAIFFVSKGETMALNYGDRVRSPFNTKKIGELISMRSKHEKSELQSKLKKLRTLKLAWF